ncbi:MAG: DUF1549 domain-containing protein [Acidobacteriia bacterium]|nr:DUF1549 domain-containing protein [Terriglobia bacterium]
MLVGYAHWDQGAGSLHWLIGSLLLSNLLYLIAAYLAGKQGTPASLILAAGVVFRLTLWPMTPALSEDVYRYRWEGMAQARGHNPYLVRPSDEALRPLRDATYERIPAPAFKAGYGPLLELVERYTFPLAAAITDDPARQAHWFKLPAVLFDLAAMAALWALLRARGLPLTALVWYAWSPMVVVEFWGNGHNDAVVVFLVTVALWAAAKERWTGSYIALALAVAAKFWPLLLFPLFLGWKRRWECLWAIPVWALLCWPYWSPEVVENAQFVSGFLGGWRNNDSLYGLLFWATGDVYRAKYATFALVGCATLWIALWIARGRWPLEQGCLAAVTVMLLLSANCHPWYLTWLFPMLALLPWPPLLVLVALMPLAYQVLVEWRAAGVWNGSTPGRWWIYGPVFAVMAWYAARGMMKSVKASRVTVTGLLLLAPLLANPVDWERARRHWSFKPIGQVRASSVDALALPKKPPIDRRSWIRRVTFDLIGLPPTPDEVNAFLKDESPQAKSKVVERLLASPHYGERWARHWLDLVRFAETNGHEFDNEKHDTWRYRDYVIRAFNSDLPYNEFVREQIAGDLMEKPRLSRDGMFLESPLGTGMYWFGEVLNSATDSVKTRADTVDNQIDVLSKAFLGLTVACARCHDHKFDPVPAADYYSLAGILHSTAVQEKVIDSPARQKQLEAAAMAATTAGGSVKARGGKWKLRPGDQLFEDFDSFQAWKMSGPAFRAEPNGVAHSLWTGNTGFTGSLTSGVFKMPKLWVHVRMRGSVQPKGLQDRTPVRVTVVADDHKSAHLIASGKPEWEWQSARMTKEIGRACYFEIVDRDRSGYLAVDAIVISDAQEPPQVDEPGEWNAELATGIDVPESAFAMIAREDSPHNVRVHVRGDHKSLGDEVPRQFLQVIAGSAQPPVNQGSGRLMLSEWMASAKNPLTARVMVNRIWKHHFGKGLVATVDNFGLTGERPANPELLDYLAGKFIASGWSVKQMHRMMVLSETYDREAPVRRLEAEAIRDAVLRISGALDPRMYGPSVMPHISKYQDGRGKPAPGPLDGNGRRSIYIQVRRNFLTPMFLAFDYPLPVSTIGSRGSSTVPSQALLMMNNEFIALSAGRWAEKLVREESDAERRITLAYEAAYARPPEAWERKEAAAFLEGHSLKDLCHVLLNAAEFIYVR